jgi:hypothetical protein
MSALKNASAPTVTNNIWRTIRIGTAAQDYRTTTILQRVYCPPNGPRRQSTLWSCSLRRRGLDIKLDHGVDNMAMAMSLVGSTR